MLAKKIEETRFREIEVKFFSMSVIDFSVEESEFPVRNRIQVHIFRDILSDKFVRIFNSPFLPGGIRISKKTGTLSLFEMDLCPANSEPLSVVMVLSPCSLYGSKSLQTTLASESVFFPTWSLAARMKLVLRSVRVRIAPLLPGPTMVSIFQSQNRVPSASLGRSCMQTLSGMFLAVCFT